MAVYQDSSSLATWNMDSKSGKLVQVVGTGSGHVIMSLLRRHIRLLHGKIGFLVFFRPSSIKRGRTHIVLG